MIFRYQEKHIIKLLKHFPAVAIIGPRQCGKSTLAKYIVAAHPEAVYLDLENPDDRAKLAEPTLFLSRLKGRLVCLDEVQFMPDIFNVLRSMIDQNGTNGQFLLLGSASPHMLRQSAETLAGRIAFVELAPFSLHEVATQSLAIEQKLWLRGGFPKSLLTDDEDISIIWRKNFIQTYLERDLGNFGINVPPDQMRRLWMMCAHLHGQALNYSALGNSLGTSHTTVRHYIDVLSGTFMLRRLEPYHANIEKRIRKSPKIYIADSGILHALLGIETLDDLISHPIAGFSWEGFVLQQLAAMLPDWNISQITTSNQAEIDLILKKGRRVVAVECKLSKAPSLSKGFHLLMQDLEISEGYVVSPISEPFPIRNNIIATGIMGLVDALLHKIPLND